MLAVAPQKNSESASFWQKAANFQPSGMFTMWRIYIFDWFNIERLS